MESIIYQEYHTRLGNLLIGSYRDQLCICDWTARKDQAGINKRLSQGLDARFKEGTSPVIDRAIIEISEFLEGDRKRFTSPLKMVGTEFQIKVWHALAGLPYGETVSYSELAGMIDKPRTVRAVAAAVGANALSILIPCHRVVGEDGSLTGYAGGIKAKRALLNLEYEIVGQQYQLFQ